MNKLLRRLLPGLDEHLSDDRLAGFSCNELSVPDRFVAKRHMAECRRCRLRQEDLEGRRADHVLHLFQEAAQRQEVCYLDELRTSLLWQLEQQHARTATRRRWVLHLPKIQFPEPSPMNPTLVTGMAIAAVLIVCAFAWQQWTKPNITSNTLLVSAERWDSVGHSSTAGVIYQSVRITASGLSLERRIYRDAQGRRQARAASLDGSGQRLRNRLSDASVDWDQPLSAASYQQWHDGQHVRADDVRRAGAHLLKLTTTAPQGDVAEQTLTVRDTDFHPVRRTVEFRDSETIEIAELDYKILPWASVDANVFEPIGGMESSANAQPARILPFPRMPEVLTAEQLDETELGARLVLNQFHADTGEQIEIVRSPQGVEVKGLVETEERKRELADHLRMMPHVTASIQSIADVKNNLGSDAGATSIRTAEIGDEPSPLKTYLLRRGRSVTAINNLARQFFENGLAISQESKAIGDLQARFAGSGPETALASATLTELIFSHRERLRAALKREHELLGEALNEPSNGDASSIPASSSLEAAAEKNMALCKELTATSRTAVRSAERILADMSVSLNQLTADARAVHGNLQSNAALKEKR